MSKAAQRLKALTYTSRARLDLSARDLVEIHQTARHLNALDGITGLLIFNGVFFLQVVEGADEAIDALIERLRADPRHSAFEVRDRRWIEERQFPGWSMELVRVSTDWQRARADIAAALPNRVHPDIRRLILGMNPGGETITLRG